MSYSKYDTNFKIDNYPFEIINLDEDNNNKLKADYEGIKDNYILVGPKKYCLLEKYKDLCPIYYNLPIRSDDVWLFGYPRSGTTLMQEMIWLIGNDLNYDKASKIHLNLRCYFLDGDFLNDTYDDVNEDKKNEKITSIRKKTNIPIWKRLMEMNERRFIKTHIPISLINPDILTSGSKMIFIMRNPKDVLVSSYYFSKSMKFEDFKGNLEDFWENFRQYLGLFHPYFEHIKEGWKCRHNPNFLFLYYEEIIQDMRKVLKKVANFLKKPLTDEQLNKLENHLKIENFRQNKSVNYDNLRRAGIMKDEDDVFIRKGKVNGWKDHFTEKMNIEFDAWIEENMKGCDLKFFE